MNRLCLMRHAKAVPAEAEAEDRVRPLARRGDKAARAIAQRMVEHGIVPDMVLCSSAVRTRQTLTAMLPVLGGQPRVSYEDGLYLAAPRTLLARLHKVAADRATVLLVGHNPGLHELAAELAGDGGGKPGKRLRDTMPTAALAVFELEGGWSGLGREETRLVHYVTPKELERDA